MLARRDVPHDTPSLTELSRRNEYIFSMAIRLIILGSTGSIGTQALEVVRHLNVLHDAGTYAHRFDVVGLAAGSNVSLLREQALAFGVRELACASPDGNGSREAATYSMRVGEAAAEQLVREIECDIVLAAVVGVAGLASTLAAVELGRAIALANKETLVAAGDLVSKECARTGSRLLPVDSEHAGIFQALRGITHGSNDQSLKLAAPPFPRREVSKVDALKAIARITLTASGGPFRTWPIDTIQSATPAQALDHPTWRMGSKVTIDSASLMNKGLEVIEAHWLFGLDADSIGVLVHPQSIVHGIIELRDHSQLFACAKPDMKTPIQQALTWPACVVGAGARLSHADLVKLEFEPPDHARFPCLNLAYDALREEGTLAATMNAANEVAVGAFLAGGAGAPRFGEIPRLIHAAMEQVGSRPMRSLSDVYEADRLGRQAVEGMLWAQRVVG